MGWPYTRSNLVLIVSGLIFEGLRVLKTIQTAVLSKSPLINPASCCSYQGKPFFWQLPKKIWFMICSWLQAIKLPNIDFLPTGPIRICLRIRQFSGREPYPVVRKGRKGPYLLAIKLILMIKVKFPDFKYYTYFSQKFQDLITLMSTQLKVF